MPPLMTLYQFGLWLFGSISLGKNCTGESGTWKALLMSWERWRYEETALIRYVTFMEVWTVDVYSIMVDNPGDILVHLS